MKMSKSVGNTINPLELMRDYGADILRLWALSVDFTEDHRIGKEILTGVADQYRKLRNTFRYLLGALDGFSEDERVAPSRTMPELERYMLALLGAARRAAAHGGRGLRFQRLHPRAGRLLQRGSVGLLLRYPQGQPLLRRADRSQAPRLSHRARHLVPRAGPLRPRRCWCSPPRKCGARAIPTAAASICSNGRRSGDREGASVRRWIPPSLGYGLGELARTSHAGDRGDRAVAPRQGHWLEPRGRSRASRRGRRSPTCSPNCSSSSKVVAAATR